MGPGAFAEQANINTTEAYAAGLRVGTSSQQRQRGTFPGARRADNSSEHPWCALHVQILQQRLTARTDCVQ
jgi:hypothetical protein